MKYIAALVVVENLEKSRILYEKTLGLKVTADYGENVTFENGFSIHEEKHYKTLIGSCQVTKKSNSFELYFEEENLSWVFDNVTALGLEILHSIAEQPWRQRVFRFYDYDKNIIEVGEPMEYTAYRLSKEGIPISDICTITYFDEKTVESSIAKYSKQ